MQNQDFYISPYPTKRKSKAQDIAGAIVQFLIALAVVILICLLSY